MAGSRTSSGAHPTHLRLHVASMTAGDTMPHISSHISQWLRVDAGDRASFVGLNIQNLHHKLEPGPAYLITALLQLLDLDEVCRSARIVSRLVSRNCFFVFLPHRQGKRIHLLFESIDLWAHFGFKIGC